MKRLFLSATGLVVFFSLFSACSNPAPAPPPEPDTPALPMTDRQLPSPVEPPGAQPLEPTDPVDNEASSDNQAQQTRHQDFRLTQPYSLIGFRGAVTINGRKPIRDQPLGPADIILCLRKADLLFLADSNKATYWLHPVPFAEDSTRDAFCDGACILNLEPSPAAGSQKRRLPERLYKVENFRLEQFSKQLKQLHFQQRPPTGRADALQAVPERGVLPNRPTPVAPVIPKKQ
ncbi:MAG: hypothetical protein R3D58_22340 [Saprospiraceae bacterium]